MKILIIEDDPCSEQLIKHMLIKMMNVNKNDILSTQNGLNAIEIFIKNKDEICLILLDLFLVGSISGFDIMKEVFKIKPDMPIFVETAQIYAVDKVMEMGCVGYVTKPFYLKDFSEKIKKYII
jgi:response regulator of citrate/malate metabolism